MMTRMRLSAEASERLGTSVSLKNVIGLLTAVTLALALLAQGCGAAAQVIRKADAFDRVQATVAVLDTVVIPQLRRANEDHAARDARIGISLDSINARLGRIEQRSRR